MARTDRDFLGQRGTRPLRPEDTDPDMPIYVALPQHVMDAERARRKTEETSRFWRWIGWIGRKFGRS